MQSGNQPTNQPTNQQPTIHVTPRDLKGESLSLGPRCWPLLLRAPVDYLLHGKGLWTSNGVDAGGYLRATPSSPYEDVQLHFFPGSLRDYSLASLLGGSSFSLNVYLSRPHSTGRAYLNYDRPEEPLRLQFNFLQDERDRQTLLAGVC